MSHWFLAAGLVVTVLSIGRAPLTAEFIHVAVTSVAAGAVLLGLRRNQTKHANAWRLLALGLMMFVAEHLCWVVNIRNGDALNGPIGDTFDVLGYVILLTGAVVALRRRTRHDVGGVLDATVFAIAGATVIWEFVILGKLTAWHTPVPERAMILTQLFMVVAGLGVLVRLAQTMSGSRAALCYMFGPPLVGFIQIVMFPVVSATPVRVPGTPVESVSMLAAICVGATALHPSMTRLMDPGKVVADQLSTRRLLLLGAAMMTAPISVGIWQLLGHEADSVLLVISAIVIVPLVIYRIRGLVRQRASAEAALAHQALHDSLTGLPNRANFVDLLNDALQRVRNGTSAHVAVLFCDLDGFKAVNDLLGHTAGDHFLIAIARRLQECVRSGDIVSRFGGDEFLVLCENLTDTQTSAQVADRISAGLERPISAGNAQVTIGASIGIAATTATGDLTAEEIIRDADLAMYAAKASGAPPKLSTAALDPTANGHEWLRSGDASPHAGDPTLVPDRLS